MTRRMLWALSLIITASLLLASCSLGGKRGDGKNLPASTGQPFEVLLEGDTLGIVKEVLTEDVDILPQPEPMCDVISARRGKVRGSYLLMRTRVVVSLGGGDAYSDKRKDFSVKVSHDENAAPQTIIRIHAASAQQLRDSLNPRVLQAAINEAELKHLAAVIKQNPEKQKLVHQRFALQIKIPASMDASKEGKDFLWLSNNASRGMQNLIFLRIKSEEGNENAKSNEHLKHQIDSMLRKNMVGETDEMYMVIPDISRDRGLSRDGVISKNDHTITRGLWEMKGDAMGGPYVMQRMNNIVIIAFVYAPEMKKRNLLKQLEAVMTTAHRAADN